MVNRRRALSESDDSDRLDNAQPLFKIYDLPLTIRHSPNFMTDAAQAPIRVLVVDDEPLAREKICGMAADDPDIRVVAECSNGAEAIEAVQTMRPDLILLDVQMPEVGGFAVLEALKDDG